MTCECSMYKWEGTCYHTGYKPSFRTNVKIGESKLVLELPADRRSREARELERRIINKLELGYE
jgi:hypothetical protein